MFADLTVDGRYPAGNNWTSNVRLANPSQACDGTETVDQLDVCAFGGPYRKVVVTGMVSCGNLSLTENLDLFNWSCAVENGTAVFYGKAKSGTRLASLLEPSGTAPYVKWKDNAVSVYKNAGLIGRSDSTAPWWGDALARLNTSAAISLEDVNKIWVVHTADLITNGINLNANNMALVVLDDVKVIAADGAADNHNCDFWTGETSTPDQTCVVAAGTQRAVWLEGAFVAKASPTPFDNGVLVINSRSFHLENVTVLGAALYGVILNGGWFDVRNIAAHSNGYGFNYNHATSGHSRLTGITASDNAYSGVIIDNVTNVIVQDLKSFSNGWQGLHVYGVKESVVTGFVISNNGLDAVWLEYFATDNVFQSGTIAQNGTDGFDITSDSTGNVLSNIAIFSPGAAGYAIANDNAPGNTVSDIAFAQMTFQMSSTNGPAFANNFFTDDTTNCSIADSNLNDGCTTGTGVTIDTGLSTTDLFALGSSPVLYDSTFNWQAPLQKYETYGRSAATPIFMDSGKSDRCADTFHCAKFDWSILDSYTGQLKNANLAFPGTSGQSCPASAAGSVYLTADGKSFLARAIELRGDESGNDNGLCESGETCIYQPNVGVYQGHGPFYSHSCTFADGTVAGVTLIGYSINGI